MNANVAVIERMKRLNIFSTVNEAMHVINYIYLH